jgi:hypothetical protein
MIACTFPGCTHPHRAKGLCFAHYLQARKGQQLRPLIEYKTKSPDNCTAKGCDEPFHAKGYCHNHYEKYRRWAAQGRTIPEAADHE